MIDWHNFFTAAMLAGMAIFELLERCASRQRKAA